MYRLVAPNPVAASRATCRVRTTIFLARVVKIERNIVTTARECNRRCIDPVISHNDCRETNRAGETSNKRALFNFASRARVTSRCTEYSDFDNPFMKESKHVPRGASSPTLSVGMIDKIDEMPGRRHSMIGDEFCRPPTREMRSLLPANPPSSEPSWLEPLKGRKMSQKGYCTRVRALLSRIGRDRSG